MESSYSFIVYSDNFYLPCRPKWVHSEVRRGVVNRDNLECFHGKGPGNDSSMECPRRRKDYENCSNTLLFA